MEELGLREKKKAILKYSILNEMLNLLKTKDFYKISVSELCKNIGTSKVTFFNYFSYKEQVLDYFVYKWQYDMSYDIQCKKYTGIDGIESVFNSIATHELGMKIMLSLITYYAKLNTRPSVIEVSEYEYFLFNENAFKLHTKRLNLSEILLNYLEDLDTNHDQNILKRNQLVSLIYGVPIQSHVMGIQDMNIIFKAGIRSILL